MSMTGPKYPVEKRGPSYQRYLAKLRRRSSWRKRVRGTPGQIGKAFPVMPVKKLPSKLIPEKTPRKYPKPRTRAIQAEVQAPAVIQTTPAVAVDQAILDRETKLKEELRKYSQDLLGSRDRLLRAAKTKDAALAKRAQVELDATLLLRSNVIDKLIAIDRAKKLRVTPQEEKPKVKKMFLPKGVREQAKKDPFLEKAQENLARMKKTLAEAEAYQKSYKKKLRKQEKSVPLTCPDCGKIFKNMAQASEHIYNRKCKKEKVMSMEYLKKHPQKIPPYNPEEDEE